MARIPAADVASAGYIGIVRYLGQYEPKRCTPAEIADAHAHGLSVMLVYEDDAESPLGGFTAGRDHGARATLQAEALGYPSESVICFAVDFDATAAQLETVAQYLDGIRSVTNHPIGLYGSWLTIATLGGSVDYRWQCEAWSGDAVHPSADLYQRIYPTRTIPDTPNSAYDEDVILTTFRGWPPAPAPAPVPLPPPPPPPARKESAMMFMQFQNGTCIVTNLATYRILETKNAQDFVRFCITVASGPTHIFTNLDNSWLADPANNFGVKL
ncbi:MAG: DUF1906 domain-containing protein [Nitrospira sp.]|nr:DUF1906 domain-containing protein [Nitrospira sp.]